MLLVLTARVHPRQVSAIHFTSASIFLFERLSLRTDSDSADVVLWEELARGKHHCCYTLTHQGHAPAWVRKGEARAAPVTPLLSSRGDSPTALHKKEVT